MSHVGFVDLFVSLGHPQNLVAMAREGGYTVIGALSSGAWTDGNLTIRSLPEVLNDDGSMREIRSEVEATAASMIYGGRPLGGNSLVLRNVMAYCSGIGVRLALIPDEEPLSRNAQVAEGRASSLSGMTGFPRIAEVIGVFRAALLAREYSVPLHLHGISTREGLDQVRRWKVDGLDVTCSVIALSLCMNEEDLIRSEWNPALKGEIPLRSEDDRLALWAGVADGTVDAVTSGHSDVDPEDRVVPFQMAPFGYTTLPGAARSVVDVWRRDGYGVTPERLASCLRSGPARLLGMTDLDDGPLLQELINHDLTR